MLGSQPGGLSFPVDHPAGDSTIERGNRFALQRRSWSSVFNCYAPTVTRDPEPSFPRGSRCPEGATAPAFASAPSGCTSSALMGGSLVGCSRLRGQCISSETKLNVTSPSAKSENIWRSHRKTADPLVLVTLLLTGRNAQWAAALIAAGAVSVYRPAGRGRVHPWSNGCARARRAGNGQHHERTARHQGRGDHVARARWGYAR